MSIEDDLKKLSSTPAVPNAFATSLAAASVAKASAHMTRLRRLSVVGASVVVAAAAAISLLVTRHADLSDPPASDPTATASQSQPVSPVAPSSAEPQSAVPTQSVTAVPSATPSASSPSPSVIPSDASSSTTPSPNDPEEAATPLPPIVKPSIVGEPNTPTGSAAPTDPGTQTSSPASQGIAACEKTQLRVVYSEQVSTNSSGQLEVVLLATLRNDGTTPCRIKGDLSATLKESQAGTAYARESRPNPTDLQVGQSWTFRVNFFTSCASLERGATVEAMVGSYGPYIWTNTYRRDCS